MSENTNVNGIVYKMSSDERARELIRMREKALHDEAMLLAEAMAEAEGYEEGFIEGFIEGYKEGAESIIAGMMAAGFTEEQIEAALKAVK